MDLQKAYDLIVEKLSDWGSMLIKMLPNLLLAVIVLVVGLFLARRLKRLAAKMLHRVSHRGMINGLLVSIIHLSLIAVVVFAALSILQLDKAVTSLLAGVGILGLGLAFAFQDIAANFISGVFISFRRPLRVGDIVKVNDYMGKVETINLRDTVVKTFQGQMVIIPNKDIFQNPIENFSLLGKRRMDLTVGVSYGDDLQKVKEITLAAVEGMEHLAEDETSTLFYNEFGDSSINFVLRIWVNTPEQPVYLTVMSDAVMRIKKAYDENDITIPFPIRTLDFGIKGGEKLSEVWSDRR